MHRRITSRLLCLVLMLTTLLAGSQFAFAARKPIPNKSKTDAAGRTHVRPAGRISDAQRRAAARKRQAVHNQFVRTTRMNGGQQ
jgi:hypothetical protein